MLRSDLIQKGSNTQFVIYYSIFVIVFQFVLHVFALFPAIIRHYI